MFEQCARRWRAGSVAALVVASVMLGNGFGTVDAQEPARNQILETMKRATVFMVETVSTNGGYVWSYLPDMSRRWGEMEARDTMIWVQPPGTPAMGHVFLDAYHATRDEYYYQAAEKAASALIWGQLPAGGWNYMIDFGGDRSMRDWYDTIGRNAWRAHRNAPRRFTAITSSHASGFINMTNPSWVIAALLTTMSTPSQRARRRANMAST